MSSHRRAACPTTVRRMVLTIGCGVLVVVATAGCATGSTQVTPAQAATVEPTAATTTGASSTSPVQETPGPVAEPTADPSATAPPVQSLPAAPPAATLTGTEGSAVLGALGSYTWSGTGSDAPWIVPALRDAVREPGPFTVGFEPGLAPGAWTARWAPVADGRPGDTAGSSSGEAGPIVIDRPVGRGAWSLQVDVQFAGGGRAAWYWRLQGTP